MLDRTIAPPIKDAIEFNLTLKPYRFFELHNGVPVYAIDAGVEDVIQVEFVFSAGNWFDPQPQVANAANALLKNGTRTKTAFEINEHFDYYGAYLNKNCYNETATLTLHAMNKHLPSLLPVIRELLSDSTYPDAELDIFKQNSKQKLLVNLQKSDFVAGRLIEAYVYGEQHPYGSYTNAADIDAIQAPQLRSFFDDYYRNGQCVLFVSGKLPADIETQLNTAFGDMNWKKPVYGQLHRPVSPAAQKKYRVANDANGVQGSVRMARNFPNRHHPDFVKVMVLNNVFGGFFGSRLMSNIREEKGYTYGIYSYLQNHLQETAWLISTEAGKDVCEATIEEVYKEMELLRNEPADEEELLLVRNYMIGTVLADLDGPFSIMTRWKNIILNGLTDAYFYHSIDTIKTVSAQELQELANKYLQPQDFYELVVI